MTASRLTRISDGSTVRDTTQRLAMASLLRRMAGETAGAVPMQVIASGTSIAAASG